MAEASLELTVTPKQLGKHLRDVRRKKGLSLSEVARGAGLSRRELVAYERGKVPIPESDLWVLAGSCGVDVAELMPRTSAPELAAGASATIGDTVAQLRRNQDDADLAPYLASLHRLKELAPGKRVPVKDRELKAIADALGREPKAMEQRLQKVMHVSPEEASRLREIILPPIRPRPAPKAIEAPAAEIPAPALPSAPPAFLDTPLDTPIDTAAGHNVDVFEELARLPEPVPLGDPTAPVPDMLAPPPPPEGTVELVDGLPQPVNASGFGNGGFGAGGFATPEPVLVDTAAAVWNAAEAPPIDVAQRQGSDIWDWAEAPGAPLPTRPTGPDSWEPTGWQPPAPPGSGADGLPAFWESTDDWTPIAPESSLAAPETDAWLSTDLNPSAEPLSADDAPEANAWAPTDWEAATWGADPGAASPDDPELVTTDPGDPWTANEWPEDLLADATEAQADELQIDTLEARGADGAAVDADAVAGGPWEHQTDPEAISSGFYVDWGTGDTPEGAEAAPAPWETLVGPDPGEATPDEPVAPCWEPEPPAPPEDDDAPPMIMWRADAGLPALTADAEPAVELEPEPTSEEFVAASDDWELGNALPLVEVRGQGALVMRRADERWALADVTTTSDFIVEVDVDFRSGPGFGVLFRASVDEAGRMSGYSFDVDPIYDGGGYLVRQWSADRELWNPIARVDTGDPSAMHGALTVRLVAVDDHLTALVNGVEVLTVESLKEASVDRGREAATGDRVGVQAWSSSDLVIDTLRVAPA